MNHSYTRLFRRFNCSAKEARTYHAIVHNFEVSKDGNVNKKKQMIPSISASDSNIDLELQILDFKLKFRG